MTLKSWKQALKTHTRTLSPPISIYDHLFNIYVNIFSFSPMNFKNLDYILNQWSFNGIVFEKKKTKQFFLIEITSIKVFSLEIFMIYALQFIENSWKPMFLLALAIFVLIRIHEFVLFSSFIDPKFCLESKPLCFYHKITIFLENFSYLSVVELLKMAPEMKQTIEVCSSWCISI